MVIVQKKLSEIKPYPGNPRVNDYAVSAVVNSIKEFGFRNPIIVDCNNVIVAGHTRYNAAKRLNLLEVPCVVADDLTAEQIKAYRIADNSTAELSEWDDDLLKMELDGLDFDMSDFGLFIDETLGKEKARVSEKSDIPKMELRAFEHYDYLVFVFDNQHDYINMAQRFGIKRVDAGWANRKMGIGRVIRGAELIKQLGNTNSDIIEEPLFDHNDT